MTGRDTIHLSSDMLWRARRLRWVGAIIGLLGLSAAVAVYWAETPSAAVQEEAAMTGFNRASERQMAVLYGKQGQFVEELTRSLKQPETQAVLILAVTAVMVAMSFYAAHRFAEEARENFQPAAGKPRDETAQSRPPGF